MPLPIAAAISMISTIATTGRNLFIIYKLIGARNEILNIINGIFKQAKSLYIMSRANKYIKNNDYNSFVQLIDNYNDTVYRKYLFYQLMIISAVSIANNWRFVAYVQNKILSIPEEELNNIPYFERPIPQDRINYDRPSFNSIAQTVIHNGDIMIDFFMDENLISTMSHTNIITHLQNQSTAYKSGRYLKRETVLTIPRRPDGDIQHPYKPTKGIGLIFLYRARVTYMADPAEHVTNNINGTGNDPELMTVENEDPAPVFEPNIPELIMVANQDPAPVLHPNIPGFPLERPMVPAGDVNNFGLRDLYGENNGLVEPEADPGILGRMWRAIPAIRNPFSRGPLEVQAPIVPAGDANNLGNNFGLRGLYGENNGLVEPQEERGLMGRMWNAIPAIRNPFRRGGTRRRRGRGGRRRGRGRRTSKK